MSDPRVAGFGFFRRIFLWFWITLLIVILAMSGMVYFLQEEQNDAYIETSFQNMARNQSLFLVKFYEHSTPDQIEPLLEIFGPRGVWMANASGDLLLSSTRVMSGGDIPGMPPFFPHFPPDEKMKAALADFLARGTDSEIAKLDNEDYIFMRVKSESGKTFATAQSFRRPRPPRMFLFSHYRGWMAGIFLLAMTVFCSMLARSFASPVLEMRAASRRFSTGELDVRVSPSVTLRHDELGDLARDFNEMAQRLGVMIERQKRLLHEISHELRSPLARIQVAIELLRTADVSDKGEMIDRLERESDRLDEMIGQILQLTRLEDKNWNIEPVPVDLVRLIDGIIADARFEAGNAHDPFRWNGGGEAGMGAVTVLATRELLGRAFENIIRNSLKFSPPRRPHRGDPDVGGRSGRPAGAHRRGRPRSGGRRRSADPDIRAVPPVSGGSLPEDGRDRSRPRHHEARGRTVRRQRLCFKPRRGRARRDDKAASRRGLTRLPRQARPRRNCGGPETQTPPGSPAVS
ncbi:MAG TPA: histidine kinase dimerization/phospho-acceptor domain-containing protein [Candidatus Ozemobacteraceae bacterium]|nr:histidine kinase dimerization/phospho-acceptor domain-containing protein [Candidatus Ozemobacteraceae bacterium]